jgi:acetyl-CoA C-acetyltransferase
LEDAYENAAMGAFAQVTANAYGLTREGMDDYTIESLARAKAAIAEGAFAEEITPVTIKTRAGEVVVDTDEARQGPPRQDPRPAPAFAKDGTITAASSSSISDGAAAMVLTRQSVEAKGLKPVAIVGHRRPCAGAARSPPPPSARSKGAGQGRLERGRGRSLRGERSLCLRRHVRHARPWHPHDKINVNGGATALGHPIGARARASRHADRGAQAWAEEGRCGAVHRRWRGTAVAIELVSL